MTLGSPAHGGWPGLPFWLPMAGVLDPFSLVGVEIPSHALAEGTSVLKYSIQDPTGSYYSGSMGNNTLERITKGIFENTQ